MLPPSELEATLRRLVAELHAGRLDPEVTIADAPPLSEVVRVEKVAAELGLLRALPFFGLDPASWAGVLQRWGPALNAVEVHARRLYWTSTLDVSADVQAIIARPVR